MSGALVAVGGLDVGLWAAERSRLPPITIVGLREEDYDHLEHVSSDEVEPFAKTLDLPVVKLDEILPTLVMLSYRTINADRLTAGHAFPVLPEERKAIETLYAMLCNK